MPHADELDSLAATSIILHGLLDANSESYPAGDEGWTANEVAAHLRDCEAYFLQRCRRILAEQDPFLESFDQEALARERDYGSPDVLQALSAFEQRRGSTIELLTHLDEAAWQRAGRHEEHGLMTIENQIRHMVSHDIAHLRQIAESLTSRAQ